MENKNFTNRIALCGIFTALALIFSYVEAIIPLPAGKTTLMRMICTILKPTEGAIYYEGTDVFEMNKKYRDTQ